MRLKDASVKLEGVSWRMFHAALVAERIWRRRNADLVITSANDGKHMKGSKHYSGEALDLRIWNLMGDEAAVTAELQKELGPDYDVVLEKDHIHLEYDPK